MPAPTASDAPSPMPVAQRAPATAMHDESAASFVTTPAAIATATVPASTSTSSESLANEASLVEAATPIAVPGLDTAIRLAYVQGNAAPYRKLLFMFRDTQAPSFAESFREAFGAGDRDGAVRLVHSLKGSAKALGALGVAALAADLEAAAAGPDQRRVVLLQLAVGTELDRLLAGLAELH